jgi:8-oxo-dGTP pyrophosphatase MutT (NUDIX family)
MIWTPHATVATIVEKDDKLLMVEEFSHDKRVFNQPAGHVDANESIFDAAIRETLEETGWSVELTAYLGTYVYTAPENGVTYHRLCFSAKPLRQVTAQLDKDIIAAHWMDRADILGLGDLIRSPLVLRCIEDYDSRPHLPLSYIYEYKP